jgi:hypothetical protein
MIQDPKSAINLDEKTQNILKVICLYLIIDGFIKFHKLILDITSNIGNIINICNFARTMPLQPGTVIALAVNTLSVASSLALAIIVWRWFIAEIVRKDK